MAKIKATIIINTGLYQDIRPEIEIEVPDNLKGVALVQWLHKEYYGILTPDKLPKPAPAPIQGKSKSERKEIAKDEAELDNQE